MGVEAVPDRRHKRQNRFRVRMNHAQVKRAKLDCGTLAAARLTANRTWVDH